MITGTENWSRICFGNGHRNGIRKKSAPENQSTRCTDNEMWPYIQCRTDLHGKEIIDIFHSK